ncbi:MAG TPA: hypothetical protein ENH82_14060 [bacterium]|nr:hypothetical protein [bacterium]
MSVKYEPYKPKNHLKEFKEMLERWGLEFEESECGKCHGQGDNKDDTIIIKPFNPDAEFATFFTFKNKQFYSCNGHCEYTKMI